MNTALKLAVALSLALGLGSAVAQPGGMGLGPSAAPAVGCQNQADAASCEARRKARFEARQKAIDACREVVGPDRRRCVRDLRMAAEDCAASASPARCAQVRDAYGRCKSFVGPDMRACMRDELPPPDCTKAADPGRCAAFVKAREACKDKPFGPARRLCVSEQPGLGN